MKIYYFSGTGNSLAVARKLKEKFGDEASILPVSIYENQETIEIDTEILGLVFPVYFKNVPDVVKSFVNKLRFKTKSYIFAIATCNAVPGHSLFTLNKILYEKGQVLSLGYSINMPGNALITPHEIEAKRLKASISKITQIAQQIHKKEINQFEGKNNLRSHIYTFIFGTIGKKSISTKKFSCTEECIGCGICEEICPKGCIKIIESKPQWKGNCATCLACFHWCPKKAIMFGSSLTKRRRYHHPEISIIDMKLRKRN
jgi:formate hydrogenlyase subunit 6/NADH:ubiquinone oxidoreductase subunit I